MLDLNKKTSREIAEYRVKLAAKNGKVENGVIANKDGVDADEALKAH